MCVRTRARTHARARARTHTHTHTHTHEVPELIAMTNIKLLETEMSRHCIKEVMPA